MGEVERCLGFRAKCCRKAYNQCLQDESCLALINLQRFDDKHQPSITSCSSPEGAFDGRRKSETSAMTANKRSYGDLNGHPSHKQGPPLKKQHSNDNDDSKNSNGKGHYKRLPANVTPQSDTPIVRFIASLPAIPEISCPKNPSLANAPFTHASIDSQNNYERLEFLGDAYLELIATRFIFARFPHFLTGKQAKLRESLVQNATLAQFAVFYHFQDRVKTDVSMARAKDKMKEKVLADVFEAYIAGVVLADDEGGFARAETWLRGCWTATTLLDDTTIARFLGGEAAASGFVENPKDRLWGLIAERDVKLDYVDEPMGELKNGDQRRHVAIYLTGYEYERKKIGSAIGVGRKEASMLAAKCALEDNKDLIGQCAETKRRNRDIRRAKMAEAANSEPAKAD